MLIHSNRYKSSHYHFNTLFKSMRVLEIVLVVFQVVITAALMYVGSRLLNASQGVEYHISKNKQRTNTTD